MRLFFSSYNYPMPLPDEIWNTLQGQALTLDQTGFALRYDRAEVECFYLPLAERLLQRFAGQPRTLIAAAGPPGSGKTAFATLLTAVINAAAGAPTAALVGMDGWHYPNAYLDAHTTLLNGESAPLRKIKGRPETFDTAGIAAALPSLRRGEDTAVPTYSRELHNPIFPGAVITAGVRLVVLEGNYWLLDEEPWRSFYPLFDFTIFLQAPLPALLEALYARHTRTGKSPQAARAQIDNADLPNIRRVLAARLPADLVVHKTSGWQIECLEWSTKA
jgi:putative kinase